MNKIRKISLVICVAICLFLLSGCAERPFLAKDGIYNIVTISPEKPVQITPIEVTWNSNIAVIQQLLLEASLVLGDLRSFPEATPSEDSMTELHLGLESQENLEEAMSKSPEKNSPENLEENLEDSPKTIESEIFLEEIIILEATFPEVKYFDFFIDNEFKTYEIYSIQIEVIGNNPGRVILNQEQVFLGIPNPNLESALMEFIRMQNKTAVINE